MENYKVVTIDYKGNSFTFKSEESIKDKIKIDNEASMLCGGKLQLAELQSAVDESLDLLLNYNKKVWGKETTDLKRKRMSDLQAEKNFDDEYKNLFNDLNNNAQFYTFFKLSQERDNILGYARLTVLCTSKPDGFNFYDQSEQDLQDIMKQLEDEQIFFRR